MHITARKKTDRFSLQQKYQDAKRASAHDVPCAKFLSAIACAYACSKHAATFELILRVKKIVSPNSRFFCFNFIVELDNHGVAAILDRVSLDVDTSVVFVCVCVCVCVCV